MKKIFRRPDNPGEYAELIRFFDHYDVPWTQSDEADMQDWIHDQDDPMTVIRLIWGRRQRR